MRANTSETYLYFFIKAPDIEFKEILQRKLRNEITGLHNLSFESSLKGSYFVGNDIVHFERNRSYVDISVISRTQQETRFAEIKTAFNNLFH